MNESSKKLIPFMIITSVISFYFSYKFGVVFIEETFSIFEVKTNPLLVGITIVVLLWVVWIYSAFTLDNKNKGQEYGSAKFGTSRDFKKFGDKKCKTMILTKQLFMSLNTRKTMRNNNILVVGGSGSGKTRFFVKPNLLQSNCSYVTTDPKGTILPEIGNALVEKGMKIKYFNTIDFEKSLHYNPFMYLKKEEDILSLIETLIANTQGKGEKSDFWVKAEKLLYQALIGYMWYELPKEEQNFETLAFLMREIVVKEDDEDYISPIDVLFQELEGKNPMHFAVLQYKSYKQAAGKTAKSILISAGARLAPFNFKVIREITSYDELDLETIGDEKTALFIITSDKDPKYNFLVGILFSQLLITLLDRADNGKGRLPIHTRFLGDEIMNICEISNLEQLIAVIRSREISFCPIVQNLAQIKARYKDNADTIIGNCDSFLFLGTGELKTAEEISKRLGRKTIKLTNDTQSKGKQGSLSRAEQTLGRELMSADEVLNLENEQCLLFIRGLRPFLSEKYKLEKHKNYKLTADCNDRFYYEYWKKTKICSIEDFAKDVTICEEYDFSELAEFAQVKN